MFLAINHRDYMLCQLLDAELRSIYRSYTGGGNEVGCLAAPVIDCL